MAGLGYVMGNVCKEAREGDWALNCMKDCPGLGSEKDSILNPGSGALSIMVKIKDSGVREIDIFPHLGLSTYWL